MPQTCAICRGEHAASYTMIPRPWFRRISWLAAIALGACVPDFALAADKPSGDAAAPTPIPIEQLFGLPQVRQPRLSPDGKKIAFLFPHEKKMALGVFD